MRTWIGLSQSMNPIKNQSFFARNLKTFKTQFENPTLELFKNTKMSTIIGGEKTGKKWLHSLEEIYLNCPDDICIHYNISFAEVSCLTNQLRSNLS
jgi:hypothetical protein